jgi:hypothetical protein
MTVFLSELGKKVAERWMALLILPGAVFVGVATAAVLMGHRNWADFSLVWRRLPDANQYAVALLAGLLVTAAGAGLLARSLARPVEYALSGQWPFFLRPLATRLTARRAGRWDTAQQKFQAAKDAGEPQGALRMRRNQIALFPPKHPTWLGDRLHAPEHRVRGEYGLEVESSWPRLWLLLPDTTRAPLAEARQRLDDATAVGGWALLYLTLGVVWWPSVVVGLCLAIVSWRRSRAAGAVYADLVEATYDVHLGDLLDKFSDPISPQRGRQLTERFRKAT